VLAARTGTPSATPELGELRIERFSRRLPARPDHIPVTVDPAVFASLAGEYRYPGVVVRVFVHEGRLFVHRSDGDEVELLPLSETRYFLFTTSYVLEFQLGADGRANKALLTTP